MVDRRKVLDLLEHFRGAIDTMDKHDEITGFTILNDNKQWTYDDLSGDLLLNFGNVIPSKPEIKEFIDNVRISKTDENARILTEEFITRILGYREYIYKPFYEQENINGVK